MADSRLDGHDNDVIMILLFSCFEVDVASNYIEPILVSCNSDLKARQE